jgi:hypothetical protein
MWGFEIGVNECGVVIGNEAEDSNLPVDAVEGLSAWTSCVWDWSAARAHMKRCTSDRYARNYGQNANAHCQRALSIRQLLPSCDAKEAWIMETQAGRWVGHPAAFGISPRFSNCYSIRDDFDEASADIGIVCAANAPASRPMHRLILRAPIAHGAAPAAGGAALSQTHKLLDKLSPALNAQNVTEFCVITLRTICLPRVTARATRCFPAFVCTRWQRRTARPRVR